MPTSAAVYCRISKDRVGAGLGVERQEQDCRELADRLGWTVTAVYTDNDISAYSGKPRPGYRALLADLEAGRADAVLAWHTDRLHRSPVELEHYITVCDARVVPTNCVKAGPLDLATPSGRLVARQLGAVARYEVEHMVERQKSAKAQAAAAGRFRGGRRAFGFEADGTTVRPIEAAAVLDATHRALRGETLASIAREWNACGVTTSTGHQWTSISVHKLLIRARNAGLVEHNGAEVARACWPAIVPESTWRAVRLHLSDPTRRRPRSSERRWLGSGLFLCGRCDDGTTMLTACMMHSNRNHHRETYRCRRGPHLGRVAQPVDDYVTMVVLERLSRPDARLLLRVESPTDTDALTAEADALRVTNAGLVRLFTDRVISRGELETERARIQARLAEIAAQMAATVAGSPLAGFADAGDVRAAWEQANVSQRKSVIDTLMVVTLLPAPRGRRPGGHYFDPDYVRIDWRK